MRKDEFARYLREVRGHDEKTVRSRLSDCARLEEYEGDLDAHFDYDRMDDLIDRLTYSTEQERRNRPTRHKVPIDGNPRTGSATLKHAARLYRDFRAGVGDPDRRAEIDRLTYSTEQERRNRPTRHKVPIDGDLRTGSATPKQAAARRYRDFRAEAGDSAGGKPERAAAWPGWPSPSEDDMLGLARVLARHARFLHPDIVAAVTEDNARHASEWRTLLDERGVDPDIYLWDKSPCAFPGVRRYAGSDELAQLSKRAPARAPADDCLILDRNNYPKHLWAFALTGREFRNRGPDGYQLAHLADHKEYKNRWREEFAAEGSGDPPRLFGLFTSAANTVFLPAAFVQPTDFSPRLRALLLRRAYRLYDGVCRFAPPPLIEKPPREAEWDPDDFEWAPPVGTVEHMPAFLKFRRARIAELAERWSRPQ